eukprot:s6421_g5.t1
MMPTAHCPPPPIRGRTAPTTRAGGRGKPSWTKVKCVEHGSVLHTSVSVLAIEIITGRQHQIRSHSAHIGHPLLRDGKYSSTATYTSDMAISRHNCLHRHRLVFYDARRVLKRHPAECWMLRFPRTDVGSILHRVGFSSIAPCRLPEFLMFQANDMEGRRHSVTSPLNSELASILEQLVGKASRGITGLAASVRPFLIDTAVRRKELTCNRPPDRLIDR